MKYMYVYYRVFFPGMFVSTVEYRCTLSYGDVAIVGEGLQNLAGRDLYRAIPAVSRDLGLCDLIRRTAHQYSIACTDDICRIFRKNPKSLKYSRS